MKLRDRFNAWCDRMDERFDGPVGRMVMAALCMLFVIGFAVMLRMASYEEFSLMCQMVVIGVILVSPVDIVGEFFAAYRDHKKEKTDGKGKEA